MDFEVNTPHFSGPLDLLLDLVNRRKLFIGDVSLSQVTDDFISYIETHNEFPLGESAEFIVVASTLMLIKSRSLLPELTLTEEEEESIHDLEERLKLYARTKELASELKLRFGRKLIFEKLPNKNPIVVFAPHKNTTLLSVGEAMQRVIASLPKKEVLAKATVRKIVSLEETIESLAKRITSSMRMKFSDFSGGDKVSIIVSFLAVLELVKRGAIKVTQENGKDIEIESENVGIPNYA